MTLMRCDKTATHMLSMFAAVYGVFIYSISFSLEMWFIVTSPVQSDSKFPSSSDYDEESFSSVPILAFILAALYFVIVIVSLLLILGIIIKSMMCLMTWLITMVIIFLPECALVLFMTIYTWGIETRNGQIEMCFYVIRAILNIFFVICVQSLLGQWKTEKQVSSYALSLSAYNAYPPLTSPYIDANCSTTINPVFKYSNGSEFDAKNFQDYVGSYRSSYIEDDRDDSKIIYATQSLDRRKLNNKLSHSRSFREEVILRPLPIRNDQVDHMYQPRQVSYQDMTNVQANHYMSRTLPRQFPNDRSSSNHSMRDVAL